MKKTLLIISVLALAYSCKMGKNYRGVEVEYPEKFRFEDTTAAMVIDTVNVDTLAVDSLYDLDWYALFNDASLDTLVTNALRNNYDLRAATENVIQAQYNIGVQRSQMLPGVGVQAGMSRGNFQMLQLPEPQTVFSGFGQLSWELDFWGKYRRLTEAAKADYLASTEGYRASQIELIATVATLYFQLLEYEALLEISRSTLALRDSMVYIIGARFKKGYIPEIDLNQAQVQRAIAAGSIPIWERSIAYTEHQLSVLTGVLPQNIETGTPLSKMDSTIAIPMGLPSDLLKRRPDILVAEQNLIAQNALAGAAQANRLPNISLTGLFGVASNDLSSITSDNVVWSIGGSLLGPVFNWNRYKRLADIEKSKTNQALFVYERTVLTAFQEVEDVLAEIASLKTELVARKEHVVAAVNAQTLSQERYNQGVTSYLEYLESQRQAFQAQQNYVGTKQQLLSAHARLYKALGGGWKID